MQAAPLDPQKAADDRASGGQHVKAQSKTDQNPAANAPPVVNATSTATDEHARENPTRANALKTPIIREIAAVPVSHKDLWDKAYVVFAGFLVLVGSLGIFLAHRTLKAIEEQTGAVLESVRAAERNTGVLMQAERGRIVIYWDQVAHIDFGPSRIVNGPLLHCFNWHCRNAGRTQLEVIKIWSRLITVVSLIELLENPDYSAPNCLP